MAVDTGADRRFSGGLRMREQRRLAAIMSVDVVGYSRLMGQDEVGTVAALKTLRRDLVDPTIAAHGGRIVKTTGDGLLLEFPSVVDAVRCAVEVQSALAARNAGISEDRRLALRVGVNLGDIIIEGDDIFGDGVNIAARLQEIAEPGGIALSQIVADAVRGKVTIGLVDIGPRQLKNIAQPVGVLRSAPPTKAATDPALALDAPPPLPDKPSIAVMAFTNMSGDKEQEYFVDGIAEDILTGLSRHRWLFVIARNSSFSYRDRAVDLRQVGRELGVRYLLEGSVRRAGGRIRVTTQLIEAGTGSHVWAEKYEGPMEAMFDLQDQITEAVVGILEPTIQEAELERARRKRPDNLDAYDLYLRGLAHTHAFTRESTQAMLDHCLKSISLDPTFAHAYALAVRAYIQKFVFGWMKDEPKETSEALDLIERGLHADRSDSLMLATAGQGYAWFALDFARGLALLDDAISLNPNHAHAFLQSGLVRVRAAQTTLALEHLTKALRLSPRDARNYAIFGGLAEVHLIEGDLQTASDFALRAINLNVNYLPAWRTVTCVMALLGKPVESREALARLLALDPHYSIARFRSRHPLSALGRCEIVFEGLRRAGLPESS